MTASRARTGAPASAREAAFATLLRAEAADAFVSILLFRTLERSALGPADRALATAITLGVLRHRERLDFALRHVLTRPLEDLPAAIRTILRMGAFQLLDMDRIPPAAAVSESVTLARRHGHQGTARLVNAVLRRLAHDGPPPPPDVARDPVGHLSVVCSHPRWLIERWVVRYGFDDAAAMAHATLQPAPSVLRVNTLRTTREDLLGALRACGLEAEAGLVDEAVRVRGSLLQRLPLIDDGLCLVQDEGAMLVSLACAPQPGQVVIDACAAPGGKTTHLAALMGNRGRLIACDVHPRKLQTLARRASTMGATCVEAHHLDAREIGARWPDAADVVVVDAPCSGLGTIRRRPEIKWRTQEADLPRHAALQRAILDGAARAVRPGGILVYSVCSLEPEEGPQVVAAFLADHPAFARTPMPPSFPRTVAGQPVDATAPGEVRLQPHRHDVDGFYIARLRRL
ncbi:MAG: 16S rRNA (cytosine(967)-C(5))-methyltransferase RsmB [Armatimonadota bacterium]|nr:16S rRNA (cytosine(967)-C(5))-methyltransferase RsmB [Armatimonadota bacterium]MDR7519023.1 16S rRNA (cytosine(967)-C(5))-methyltransferase RsmB [Armatimonadota bacterium]MDR7549198.1 16S rRNA (cytosine(967)-C(5))-methyltransferase RsmB [Armatimonadota bacterium]